jgi:hypothetical protein
MSYTRVMVFENSIPYAKGMSIFRKQAQPGLNAMKKAGVLKGYSLIQTGEYNGLLITEFDTKAKMNKFVKALSAVRQDVSDAAGQQAWIYSGQVKASG